MNGIIVIESEQLSKPMIIESCTSHDDSNTYSVRNSEMCSVTYDNLRKRVYIGFINDSDDKLMILGITRFEFVPYFCRNCKYFQLVDANVKSCSVLTYCFTCALDKERKMRIDDGMNKDCPLIDAGDKLTRRL